MLASVAHAVKQNFDFCATEVCRTRDGGLLPKQGHKSRQMWVLNLYHTVQPGQ